MVNKDSETNTLFSEFQSVYDCCDKLFEDYSVKVFGGQLAVSESEFVQRSKNALTFDPKVLRKQIVHAYVREEELLKA